MKWRGEDRGEEKTEERRRLRRGEDRGEEKTEERRRPRRGEDRGEEKTEERRRPRRGEDRGEEKTEERRRPRRGEDRGEEKTEERRRPRRGEDRGEEKTEERKRPRTEERRRPRRGEDQGEEKTEERRRPRRGVMRDAEHLEEVASYKYLGRLTTSHNEMDKGIDQRLTSGWRRFGEHSHFLKDSKISICLKRKIMDTVLLPVMTYGAEAWILTKVQERKMAVTQQSMERALLNITKRDKIQNEVIRWKTKVVGIIDKVQCMREQWAGHIAQNEQRQMGQDNIRVHTQSRKTSKRKT